MPGFVHLLRCVGKAVVKHGLRALAGLVPMGGPLYDIATDVWSDFHKDRREHGLRAEIAALAGASPAEARRAAAEVVHEVAADKPPEEQAALASYLAQVPATVRQSLRRPADPSGKTVPATLSLRKPEDLLPFLPQRLPRFKPGDQPLPGVEWELVELLGMGGFGEVWKARHSRFDGIPPVALKFCLDAQAKEQLLKWEGRVVNEVMRAGRHPGIVPLLDAYLKADPLCLKYEYVAGGDLAAYLQELSAQGGASPTYASTIVTRLARTVGFVHRLDPPIVHRDLKPANILVQRLADGKVTLRIADFGIGAIVAEQTLRREKNRPTSHPVSLPNAVRGAYTPIYASPQQRRGDPADVRDDVHALGIIWHQLLAGDLTAERPGGRGWRKKLESSGMAPALLDLLESCIDDDPAERPANADDLAGRIEMLLGQPSSIPPTVLQSENRKPGGELTLRVSNLDLRFAWVPPGEFMMGSNEFNDEKPIHRAKFTKGFYMGVFPIMQWQWIEVMGNNPSGFRLENRPVEQVTWEDCQEFCAKLTQLSGKPTRLPTEAEWEYACRAGTTTDYCSGAGENALKKVGWYSANSRRQTHPVGGLDPNAWGLYDMHGNVWEWCQDWHGPYPGDVEDYRGPNSGDNRVFRGGSWINLAVNCRAAFRQGYAPGFRYHAVGCRVCFVPN
jgi:formylglycine-generating enzyme required for sulfatase activity